MAEKPKIKRLSLDDPLKNPSDDCLDRAIFARRIFKIIEGVPLTTNIRIGIHGSWGSGKTTAMNFLKWYCEEAGHPVASYNPWQFYDREEAWKAFVASIDKGIANWQGRKIGSLKRKDTVRKAAKAIREATEITTVGKAIGSLLIAPLEGMLEYKKQQVQHELSKALKDKKLYIFIDDLDRAEPHILYDFLMLLNQIVDLNQCVYVIGLDKKVASEVLKNKIGFEESEEFLEKIINWPFDLPEPTDFDWQNLLDSEIKNLHESVKKEALYSIFPQLPRNPRKFKAFLRYISALHEGFLSRFGDHELDWKILYLAQLLRIEFPSVFEGIINNEEMINDLSAGIFTERSDRNGYVLGEKKEPKWVNKLKALAEGVNDRKMERLTELYRALRESGGFIRTEYLKNHFLVIEAPELFTWKEYDAFKKDLLSSNEEEILKKLVDFISGAKKNKEIEKVREFIKMLVRERDRMLTEVAEMHDQEEMQTSLKEVKKVMKICFILLDIDDIFQGHNPIFNEHVFEEWYRNLAKWAHFRRRDGRSDIDMYPDVRQLETELALKLANKMVPQASLVLNILPDHTFADIPQAFEEVHKEVKTILQKALSKQLVDRFKMADGIGELWGKERYWPEKRLLFYKNKLFHNKDVYRQLKDIAKEALHDPQIQKNFLEYITMLFYGATEVTEWTQEEEAQKLLKDKEFVDIIWKATVSRPMNRRTVGSLEKYRKKITNEILQDKDALPVPRWWKDSISDVADEI